MTTISRNGLPTIDTPVPAAAGVQGSSHDALDETVAPKQRKNTQLSREQILEATAQCLRESQYDGTTIRRIAGRLDCAVGSIYRYFDDKRALLTAVTEARFEPIAQMAAAEAEVLDASQAVRAISAESTQAYVQVATAEPEQYRLMFWLASVGKSAGQAAMPAVVERIIEAWANQRGDRRRAEHHWAKLHGQVMLGSLEPSTIATSARPAPAKASVASSLDQPVTPPPHDAPIPQSDEAGRKSIREDVTLL